MARLKTYLLLCLLLVELVCFNLFNKVELSKNSRAKCLDGSPYAFYLYQDDNVQLVSNKLLIYFEDLPSIGWCVSQDLSTSLQACSKLTSGDYGSSVNYDNSQLFLNGILSRSYSEQPANWNKVLIKSCDGGAYLGNRDPIEYKKTSLYFRGSQNVIETFNYLLSKFNLTKYQQIIISGSFNGGIAAIMWSSYLSTITSVPITILTQAALFPNVIHKSNQPVIENKFRNIQKLVLNGDAIPNKQCYQQHSQQQWKCLFAEQLSKHVNIPTFYVQSLYDPISIKQILGYSCAQQFGSLSECLSKQKIQIQSFSGKVKSIMKIVAQNNRGGGFGISCVAHDLFNGKWTNQQYEVPMNSGNMPNIVVSSWIKSKSQIIHIDDVDWPNNQPCSHKALSFQSE